MNKNQLTWGGKMMLKRTMVAALFILLLGNLTVYGQITTAIKGVAFVDYYYNFSNHSNAEKDRNAFTIRRVYFTFENTITPYIKIRFRLESAHGDYGSTSKINPFVKHAYLEWNNLIPNHKLYLGIAETNAFKNSETCWGYRSIEKTIMDLNKISPSADMGIALKGDLGNVLHHWLTFHNGPGYGSSEVDRYKKIGYALWITPVKGLMIEGYADYENQNPNDLQTASVYKYAKNYTGSASYNTLKGFVGYDHSRLSVGAEVFMRTHKESGIQNVVIENDEITSATLSDVNLFGYSIFGSLITPIPKLKAFLRYDFFDPNTGDDVYTDFSGGQLTGGINDDHTLIIAGLDYIPQGNIHIMPNIIIKSYSQDGKDSDLTGRITLYYKFNSGKITVE
jgi:hypothetical protein